MHDVIRLVGPIIDIKQVRTCNRHYPIRKFPSHSILRHTISNGIIRNASPPQQNTSLVPETKRRRIRAKFAKQAAPWEVSSSIPMRTRLLKTFTGLLLTKSIILLVWHPLWAKDKAPSTKLLLFFDFFGKSCFVSIPTMTNGKYKKHTSLDSESIIYK